MDRRDFFGIIAAPLLRRALPPAPMASVPTMSIGSLSILRDDGTYVPIGSISDITISRTSPVLSEVPVFLMDRGVISVDAQFTFPSA